MTRKALALITLLAAVLVALPAAPAGAATRGQIIKDCQDGTLDGSYTPAELRDARQNLPGDVAQYTDCDAILRDAEIPDRPGTAAGTGSGATGQSSDTDGTGGNLDRQTATTPGDAITLAQAAQAKAQPVTVDPKTLKPVGAVRLDQSTNPLPTPVLIVLAGLAVGIALTLLPPVRRLLQRARR